MRPKGFETLRWRVIVECEKCGAKNRIPDPPKRGKRYACSSCGAALTAVAKNLDESDATGASRSAAGRDARSGLARWGAIACLCLVVAGIAAWAWSATADKVSVHSKQALDIVMYPSHTLRETAQPLNVDRIGEEDRELATMMINTLEKADGQGLAAPQVGVPRRMIVVRLERPPSEDDIFDVLAGRRIMETLVMVNPEIIEREGMVSETEGCLSLPRSEWDIEVPRNERIAVSYWTLEGQQVVLEEEGSNARVIQHEIDHLDGVLTVDYSKPFSANPVFIVAILVLGAAFLVEMRFRFD